MKTKKKKSEVSLSNYVTRNMEKKKATKKILMALLILVIVLGILIIITALLMPLPEEVSKLSKEMLKKKQLEKSTEFVIKQPLFNSTRAITYLPAVDSEGNGVITLLVVEAVPGNGRTLVDIDNLLFWGDTQHSIRIAKNVASNITGIDADNYDLVYNIYANASVIGGESAGAALTIATIAVLENKTLRDDVIITGTINHDGTIGPVQAILPKAKAAKENNASLFLVPLLQSREITYETKEHCEKFGPAEFCTTEQIPKKINISEEVGIEVREVGSIQEALQYFFKM
ncbi:MAG: hypothetical protein N3G19_02265 [Candidatus Pacearchaeota archaeon]|nr:hypothetical protein [Candidatus Pacearchaeota archaeon]